MVSPAANTSNNAQSQNSATSASASGTTSPLSAAPSQPTARSYASATKKQLTPPAIASSSPPVAVGGSQAVQQHGKSASISPVNGKTSIPPAVPSVVPAIANSSGIANGSAVQSDHSRKSSVTISSSQGYTPNGGPGASNNRASGLTFGSMNAGGSPAIANSVPHNPQNTSLATPPASNPRITSPATSPSPIPTPAASGGRPPSGLQGQGMALNFGSTGGDSNDQNMRAVSMPQGPSASLGPQAQHLRRESSQSSHSDMGAGGMNNNMNRGYNAGAGRGRGYQQNFGSQMVPSPVPRFAQPFGGQQRGGPQSMPPFQQPGGPIRHPSSPYQATRSPAMQPAQLQQQHMPNGAQMVYGYHPAHLQPQPQVGYGMPQFDPGYAAAYQYAAGAPYMHPGMQYPGPPSSPRPQFQQHVPGQPYVQGQYGPPPHAQTMARTPSQGPERPPSTLNQPPTPSMQPATQTPSQTSGSPAPVASSNFTIPARAKSKGIVIKNAQGEVVTFDKQTSSSTPTSTTQTQPPAVVSSTPTPPPKSSTPQQAHAEKESQPQKTKEEVQQELRDKIARSQRAEEPGAKAETAITTEPAVAEAKTEPQPVPVKEEAKAEPEEKKAEELPKPSQEETEEEKKRREDEEMEKMIAEMEAAEKEEEERQRQYEEKKKLQVAEKKKRDAEAKAKEDDELKRQEREAEALEEAREKARAAAGQVEETEEAKAEREKMFASLKKPTLGPGALADPTPGSGTSTPLSDVMIAEPSPAQSQTPTVKTPVTNKPKPAALKLETNKPVEPAQPTAGMQSLKSARFLAVKETIRYPDGFQSPNPSLNLGSRGKGRQYDKAFLLQFQDVFKEKPSVDWDSKVKETVGDGTTESARPQSARTPSGMGRQASRGGIGGPVGHVMGSFGSGPPGRTLPPGTTSQDRFKMSMQGPSGLGMPQGLGNFSRPGGFAGAPPMVRNPSTSSFQPARTLDSPRQGSSRGNRSRKANPREEAEKAAKMPLTAGQELKPLEHTGVGWKATSLGPVGASAPPPGGRMAPDMVQRKVKSALNKMTPEKFEKIADEILKIAGQSKDETDGRTLRQVIALTFEKACDEAHWASMYARFCKRMLETMSTEIKDENVKDKKGDPVVGGALFRKYLLNRCQEEFERGWEVDLPDKPEGQTEQAVLLSDEYYIAAAAKRRGLGLIQFIGELFKLSMLTERIMHECVMKLLNFDGLPDESAIESLVKLLRTIGAAMETTEKGQGMLGMYFDRIHKIANMSGLPSRLKYMLMDLEDLRRSGWRSKDDAKGPKTITEIHQEVAQQHAQQEMQRAQQRQGGGRPPVGRGDARSFSSQGMPPPDYPRNQVNMADLRNLTRGTNRNVSSGPGSFGPSSLLSGSRSNSGRRGLGPGSARPGEDSGVSSRTGTPPAERREPTSSVNAFSALQGLNDAAGEGPDDVASPPSEATSSPPAVKSTPALTDASARTRSKSPLGGGKSGADGAGGP